MIIFLYGPDTYRLRQNTDTVIESYRKKYSSGVNLFKFDFISDAGLEKYEDAIKSNSFFDEVKLIVLKGVFSRKSDSSKIEDLIRIHSLTKEKKIVLLLVENQTEKDLISKNSNLFRLLSGKDSVVRDFKLLQGNKLTKFVKNEFELRKCSIEPRALAQFISIVGNDSWALVNEISKLCNFKRIGIITGQDVALLSFKKENLNIFNFVDAVAGKDKTKAYELIYREIEDGRDPYYLLTMIIYSFRNLLTIKDLSGRSLSAEAIAKKSGLHPFVVRKTYQSAKDFDLAELKSAYNRLLSIDTSAKEGTADLIDSLFGFTIS